MSHLDRQHRSPRGSRLLALPLVLLCALAYLGSAAHYALVQHETCVEHGETVHAGEVHAQARPAEVQRSFEDSRIARASQVAAVSHGAEAHCAHHFFRREAPPPPEGVVPCAEVSPTSGPASLADAVHVEPIARLRLAPKSSPPRV